MDGCTTHQSDIYQVGLVLLTLLSGQHPIPPHISREQTQKMIIAGIPRQQAESLIPTRGGIARILAKMLPRHRGYRYKTAVEAISDLQAEYVRFQEQQSLSRLLSNIWPAL